MGDSNITKYLKLVRLLVTSRIWSDERGAYMYPLVGKLNLKFPIRGYCVLIKLHSEHITSNNIINIK